MRFWVPETWGSLSVLDTGLVRLTDGQLIDANTGLPADPWQYRYTATDCTHMPDGKVGKFLATFRSKGLRGRTHCPHA